MSEKNQFDDYLPQREQDNQSIEIPADQSPMAYDRIPSSNDPMGRIELRGRAFQRLASGRVPWWQLISGWIFFGTFAFMLAKLAISFRTIVPWLFLVIAMIPLVVLLRGTIAKLSKRSR